jgi:hypothetical protein
MVEVASVVVYRHSNAVIRIYLSSFRKIDASNLTRKVGRQLNFQDESTFMDLEDSKSISRSPLPSRIMYGA